MSPEARDGSRADHESLRRCLDVPGTESVRDVHLEPDLGEHMRDFMAVTKALNKGRSTKNRTRFAVTRRIARNVRAHNPRKQAPAPYAPPVNEPWYNGNGVIFY